MRELPQLQNKKRFDFELKDIQDYLNLLNSLGEHYIETDEGGFLFKKIKITIASSKSKGGKGNGLSYFYAAKNIDHLVD